MFNPKVKYTQLKHIFLLHPEYIHHAEIDSQEVEDSEDDDDFENDDAYQEEQEASKIKDSEQYPKFTSLDALKEGLCMSYPGLQWEEMPVDENLDQSNQMHCAKIVTEGDLGLLEFIIYSENGIVYYPLRIESSLTDYPYQAVRKLAQQKKWFLYHFNGFEYLDVEDDAEIGNDYLSPLTKDPSD